MMQTMARCWLTSRRYRIVWLLRRIVEDDSESNPPFSSTVFSLETQNLCHDLRSACETIAYKLTRLLTLEDLHLFPYRRYILVPLIEVLLLNPLFFFFLFLSNSFMSLIHTNSITLILTSGMKWMDRYRRSRIIGLCMLELWLKFHVDMAIAAFQTSLLLLIIITYL